jgi:hypothetical protein
MVNFRNFIALLLLAANIFAGDLSFKIADQAPPREISEPVRALLQSKAIQLLDGDKPVFQIWLRQEVPLKSKPQSPAAGPSSLSEFGVVGAISIQGGGFKDYKDNDIPSGVFTARFAQQPQDGDHLGSAEFNTFVVLIGADSDKAPDAFTKFTPMVKASGKLTPSGHPLVLSLRPASGKGEPFSLVEPAPEHKAIRLKITGKTAEGEKAEVIFDLVYQGHGHIQ